MSFAAAERLVQALLFEGHVLYPYRASSLKNQQRWAFGSLYPKGFCKATRAGDASFQRTECLVSGEAPRVRVAVRFLQFVTRTDLRPGGDAPWNEAVERRVETEELSLPELASASRRFEWSAQASSSVEGDTRRTAEALHAVVDVSASALAPSLWKLVIRVENETDTDADESDRARAELRSLASTHTLLGCTGGRFVSRIDPAPEFLPYDRTCECVGAWPVLIGDLDDTVLSSPIVLGDRPAVAEKSHGDLFDATEIDEILSLRILTLTPREREEVLRTDPRGRALLQRTESMGQDEMLALHGAWSSAGASSAAQGEQAVAAPRAFAPGEHVVLRPGRRADALDILLTGEPATVLGVEEDVDGRVYYTVTVDADPGRDLGELGQPGHRFFFGAEELERAP